jgi:hypothetical protein
MKFLIVMMLLFPGAAFGAAMPFRKLKLVGEMRGVYVVKDVKNQKMTISKKSLPVSQALKLKKNYGKLVAVRVLPKSLKKMKKG